MAPIQPGASTANTSSSSFRTIGDYVYLYSGVVGVTGTSAFTTLFEARTGSGVIVAKVQFGYVADAGDKIQYRISLNDLVVQSYSVSGSDRYTSPDNPINIILPPFTKLTLDAVNLGTTTSRDQCVSLVGRVYGTKE